MTKTEPNVVPNDAAMVARSFVFEHRAAAGIAPYEVVAEMLDLGCGSEFPSDVRGKRLKTWTLQVLRRLRKRGWLGAPTPEGWPTTAALRACTDPEALGKRARQATGRATAPSPAARPTPTVPPAPGSRPDPSPPESWEFFIQDWVFNRRERDFGVAELAVAVVQRGFGSGEIGERLDAARDLVEQELGSLEDAGLVFFSAPDELWHPTELLRTWPTRD